MDSGWGVVLGAAIATVGSVIAPWVTARWTRRAEDRRERERARSEVVRDLVDAWVDMAVCFVDDREDDADAVARRASNAISRLAIVLGKGDGGVLDFAYWVSATAIPDAPAGKWAPVAHWAAAQMFEWNWGDRMPNQFVRDLDAAARHEVGTGSA